MRGRDGIAALLFSTIVTVIIMTGGPTPDIVLPDYVPDEVVILERPTVNLPFIMRQGNWRGNRGEGSCVYATMTSLLRWQGKEEFANYWRENYENGSWPERLVEEFEKEDIRYAYTTDGNVDFLEWAVSTRRGCGITVMGGIHMVALVHLDDEVAGILDNNYTENIKWVSRESMIAEWQSSRGWAVTPVYTPSPPLKPKKRKK